MRHLDVRKEDRRHLAEQTCSQDRLIEYLTSFFNNEQDEPLKKKKPRSVGSETKQLFLLCLDNAEEIILNDKDEFTKFLAYLYDNCPNIRIIVTSYRDIGRLPNGTNPLPFFLRQLRSQSAV